MILKKFRRNPFDFLRGKSFSFCAGSYFDSYSASKILSNCFKSGKVKEAEKLFDEIPERNVVSWSILIHGQALNGFYKKSVESFSRMRISGLFPNPFTFVGVLVGVRGIRELVLVQSVHATILKSGFESDRVVCTALLDTYAKCGNVISSYKLFEGMENPGIVSCNAMISGYVSNHLFEEGFMLFNQFRRYGLVPNASMMLIIIQDCIGIETRLVCESIHGLIVKLGLVSDLYLNNAVLAMYSYFMDLDAVIRVFNAMKHKDAISWTTMIGLLVNLEFAIDALNLFAEMRAGNIYLDAVIVINLTSACAVLGDSRRGRQIHAQSIVHGFESELPLANSLIAMYSKCSDLVYSKDVFNQMNQKSLVSWTAMISGYLQNGYPAEALNLYMKVRLEEDDSLDSAMIVNALTACGEIAAFELCQQLHSLSFKAGFPCHRLVQNSLISVYSNCGNMEFAYHLFKEMGNLQNVISWNSIINGYGINGFGDAALARYKEMRKYGEKPNSATYSCILSACSYCGLIKEGLTIFNQMLEDGKVNPANEHYGCVVDLLARAGCLLEASVFIGRCLDMMGPNVLRALLSGCVLYGNAELAEFVAKRLLAVDPGDSGHVVMLSNVYASVGRFEDTEKLRMNMQNQGLRKNPGVSLSNDASFDFG